MGYFSSEPPTQPRLATRHDYIIECRRLTATGMHPKAIAKQLGLTRIGVLELLLDDSALKRRP